MSTEDIFTPKSLARPKLWRRLSAFLISPLPGAAIFSLMLTIELTPGRIVDFPMEHYAVFLSNWLSGAVLTAVWMYFFTVLLVAPAYLLLIYKKRFSLKSMLVVGAGAAVIPFLWYGMAGSDRLNILATVSVGLVGLLSGFVFFMVHGRVKA